MHCWLSFSASEGFLFETNLVYMGLNICSWAKDFHMGKFFYEAIFIFYET